ncbi:hypothetical protein DMUE_1629 [Dictyocoela muelleri]|nr:hypothetical protein DMUE_1629 [Dictyocoela muelleri]
MNKNKLGMSNNLFYINYINNLNYLFGIYYGFVQFTFKDDKNGVYFKKKDLNQLNSFMKVVIINLEFICSGLDYLYQKKSENRSHDCVKNIKSGLKMMFI